jgi:hypothetical protein
MTDKIILELTLDELKVLDKHIEYNDETQSVFDKIKVAYPQPTMTLHQEGEYDVVSYNYATYYRLMGETTFSWYIKAGAVELGSATHPVPTLVMVTDAETERLLDGLYYNHIQVKKEKGFQPTPQTPEQVADGLKEAFREAVKQGVVSSADKPKTLTDLIYRWWGDVFTTHSDWDMETSIEDLVDQIQLWLPKEQSTAGSQNAYVECTVEGFNDCLKKIKGKLR